MAVQIKPAPNVIFSFIGGAIAYGALLWAKHIGYHVDSDVADGLPYAVAVAIAHLYDVVMGTNKPPLIQVEDKIRRDREAANNLHHFDTSLPLVTQEKAQVFD